MNVQRRPRGIYERPQIIVNTEVHEIIECAINALYRLGDVYKRGSRLAVIVRPSRYDEEDRIIDEPSEIRQVTGGMAVPLLTEAAEWVREAKKDGEIIYVPTIPPAVVVNGLLDAGEYPAIQQLIGLSETPIVCPGGEINWNEGYDDETGVYFAPNAKFIKCDRKPTQDEARAAYKRLVEVVDEFPFDSPDLGRSVFVAALLTILGRNAIRGSVPAFLVKKNVRGSGGTLIADVIHLIATGRPAGRMTFPEDHEEQEKVLSAFAMRGTQVVTFDNAKTLGGGPLDKCLTAVGTVDLRVLGKTQILSVPWRAVVIITGNNVEVLGDTSRRVLLITITSKDEKPELRGGWKHYPLREYVLTNRITLVRDALTILAAHSAAKRIELVKPLGSFEEWSKVVASAIVFAGGTNPIDGYAEALGVADAEREAMATLLDEWKGLDPAGAGITVKQVLALIYPPPLPRGEERPPDGFDALRSAVEELAPPAPGKAPTVRALGNALANMRKRVIANRFFDGKTGKGGAMKWQVREVKQGESGDTGESVSHSSRERSNGISTEYQTDSPDSLDSPSGVLQ